MTKQLILPLVALILLSACAGKMGLQKRRYTKGYYFSVAKKNHNTNDKHSLAKNTKHDGLKTIAVNDLAVTEPVQVNQPSTPAPVAQTQHHSTASSRQLSNARATTAPHLVASVNKVTPISRKAGYKTINPAQAAKGSDSSTNTVVLIILSIFPILALIAMYLHDGHKITLNFWVDLILHLTVIGYFIFALLVVLDVVDLA